MGCRSKAVLASVVLLAVAGCKSRQPAVWRGALASTLDAGGAPLPYPPAPYRVLSLAERERIVIWVSHVLISHRDQQEDIVLRSVTWHPDTPPARSRSEALKLALRLADDARAHPETFEALARQNSDDEVTRANGGSLGGQRASSLPLIFIDALTVMHSGEVSRVIETSLGYHILMRRSPPPEEDVEGRHIVIRYAGTSSSIDNSPSDRTRDQALALANLVAAQARDGAASFESLVSQYSEHADRIDGGDIGVWSTRAPGNAPREVELLSHLKTGEVASPIDSVLGFQVFQRIEPSSRGRLATAAIRMQFEPQLPPEDPRSRGRIRDEAYALARKLHGAPSTFVEVQRQHRGKKPEVFEWGHESPQITRVLENLRFGEVASEPAEIPFYFVIPMRLDPALVTASEPPVPEELPIRADPNLESLFRNATAASLSGHIAEFLRPEALALLHLSNPEQNAFRSVFETLQGDLRAADTADARVHDYRLAAKAMHEALPEATYARVTEFVAQQTTRMLLVEQGVHSVLPFQ
jgi:hypothetical protein